MHARNLALLHTSLHPTSMLCLNPCACAVCVRNDCRTISPAVGCQVVIEKFTNYFDVELRKVPVTGANPRLRADVAAQHCDENTIGVVALLGSTYTGHFDDVEGLSKELDSLDLPHGYVADSW